MIEITMCRPMSNYEDLLENQNAFYEANYARYSVKSRFSVAKWGDQQLH